MRTYYEMEGNGDNNVCDEGGGLPEWWRVELQISINCYVTLIQYNPLSTFMHEDSNTRDLPTSYLIGAPTYVFWRTIKYNEFLRYVDSNTQ